MKKIALSGGLGMGLFILIDNEDYKNVSKYKWYYHKGGYARGGEKGRTLIQHLIIGHPPKNLEVNHINLDKLDNRKNNLEFVDRKTNLQRKKKYKRKFNYLRGVICVKSGAYQVRIGHNYKHIYLGSFPTEVEAAIAFDNYVILNNLN